MSKIENKFANIFTSAGVKFVREKTFPDLKNGYLRYDFYLPELNTLVEVDSMLHSEVIPKFHKTKHQFTHAQENDRIKNSYALSHGLKLYRLPEWEFDNINTFADVLQDKFLVRERAHNDKIYREYKKRKSM